MAVAGYLFGLAGELAIKEMMRNSGMKPLHSDRRREDPFYAHFPYLKSRLRDSAAGRRAGELRRLAEAPATFQNWHVDMRYARTDDISSQRVEAWRACADDLVSRMDAY